MASTQTPKEIEALIRDRPANAEDTGTYEEEVAYLEKMMEAANATQNARNAGTAAALNIEAKADVKAFIGEGVYTDTQISLDIRLENLKTLQQNNAERKRYAGRIFLFTCIWAVLIFVVIFLAGFKVIALSDTVEVTLISTTTINFFGFFLLVVKYLFNTGANGQDAPPKE